ncbi:hypothetical protein BGZ94_005179, partial [Podila epigama]
MPRVPMDDQYSQSTTSAASSAAGSGHVANHGSNIHQPTTMNQPQGQQLATLLRGKLNDYGGSGSGFLGIGLDISRSSSAPPNQGQFRFGIGPGFDSQPSSDL